MIYSFELRQEAVKEFTDAFVWYEELQEGLGIAFRTALQVKLKQICNNPLHYKKSHQKFHQALTNRFPFLIVYTIDETAKHILVFAIFHTSRNIIKKFRK